MKPPRRTLLLLGLIIFVALALVAGGYRLFRMKSRPPDIILVIIDTIRADALSIYGNPQKTSPNIDALAAEGAIYENAKSASAWTSPAIASMFTGQIPSKHGLHLENVRLAGSRETLAEILGQAGYQTAAFSNNPFFSHRWGLEQGFDHFRDVWRDVLRDGPFADTGGGLTHKLVEKWLEEGRDPDRPLFLIVHYMEPHFPYNPPSPYDRKFVGKGIDPEVIERVRGWESPYELGYIFEQYTVSPEEFRALRSQYHGEIGYVDEKVGDLMRLLRERGLYEEAAVILTGDHGENLGEHDLMDHKFCLYDTLLRVPLIIRHPPRVKAGERITRPVQTHDIFRTVLDLAGVPAPGGGRSLSLIEDGPEDREIFSQQYRPLIFLQRVREDFPDVPIALFDRQLSTVEQNGVKYIWSSDGRHEMYDIRKDPGEMRNIVEDRPEEAAALRRKVIR